MLNASLPARLAGLCSAFSVARPFRHVVIDDFLEPSFCARLIDSFPQFDERRAISETGAAGRKAVNPDLRSLGPDYEAFDSLVKSAAFLEVLTRITSIPSLLYDPEYAGGGTHENLDGQDLDLHVDFNYHPRRLTHRRLNLIVFLNPEWQPEWGGCLELVADPWAPEAGSRETVVPAANRAVIFETTESSWHGFSRITLPPHRKHLSRRSLAVYFYTRHRAATETAPSHGTIYIPRPLPDHLRAGYTLTPDDVDTLNLITARRDAQIRFLYERELEFSETLSGITRSPSFRLGRALTWPLRRLRGR